ncbi:inorganic phosphate transporter [Halalkalicoccus jeotgali]|uniref:Phosphate transporter n=1 Tax=Halalkalicoccus jeotgali (strain DSM 18796 / CECT 7217 / JCM 14584 / KCTC 4019 / B3) TaxID=795797 RepID=D8JAE8_HALJB|nr:inorganic phosphate transporter [Halalkalicoccus jeotgali]ADJ14670.1 phosphate transporter [Halalkalicoccus jeotgali B3]ELY39568.1 phosphate transporter [Halalkalicoccus jeotgali B3]
MVSVLLVLGMLAAVFVGFNIGGSSTGVAWGPSVGAKIINKTAAAALMTFFVFLGGWTVGRNVIDTLGGDIVPQTIFTIEASIIVLFFIGLGMMVANVYGVPVSTSMTAVGAISGLGLATGQLDMAVLGGIVIWWLVAPITGFWCGAVVGRYLYPHLDRRFALEQSEGPLLVLDRTGAVPKPTLGPGTTSRELISTVVVVLIACYMAFSAGASNVANAVAPLVGGGLVGVEGGVVLATVAIGLGAFTIARRTMDSVGNDLTALPLLAAMIVMIVAASITTVLSWIGIPISLAMATVMCIVGLGWGRATRQATARDLVRGDLASDISVDAITAETTEEVPRVGEERPEDLRGVEQLFDGSAVIRFVSFWIIGPSMATILSYLAFVLLPIAGTP